MVTILLELLPLFQSTLPYGSDVLPMMMAFLAIKFQSTLPYGSDQCLPTANRKK